MTSAVDLSKVPPQTAHFSEIWLFIKFGVHQLMNFPERISATEFMNLSVAVYDLANGSMTHALEIQKKLVETFGEHVQQIVKEAAELVDVDFLRYYVTELRRYKTGVERVDRAFAYYNRRWTTKVGKGIVDIDVLLPIQSLALTSWKMGTKAIQGDEAKLTSAILRLIMKERSGEEVDEDLVKNVIDSFIALDINHRSPGEGCLCFYQEQFEASFLQATADYHKRELEAILQSKSENFISDYLDKVEEKLLDEERRAKRYLPQETHDKVMRTVLISDHCETLGEVLLQPREDEKLRRMYTLLSRIKPDGWESLKKGFEIHVKTESAAVQPVNEGETEGLVAPDIGDASVNFTNMQSLSGQPSLSDTYDSTDATIKKKKKKK